MGHAGSIRKTSLRRRSSAGEDWSAGALTAKQVAWHALLVAAVGITELAFEVALFADHDGEVQHDPARNDEQLQPVERKNQRDRVLRGDDSDIKRIAGPSKDALGQQRGRRLPRMD